MTRYLEFPSRAEADAFMSALDKIMGYPKSREKTDTYTRAVEHPTSGRAACAIDADGEKYLSRGKLSALKTYSDVAAFFPREGRLQ